MSTAVARFKDNTTVVPVDRRRVYGFMPGINNATMPVDGSNQPSEFIGQGQLILFKPHVNRGVDADWKPKTIERSAARFSANVEAIFRYGPAGDMGYRPLDMLTDLAYDPTTGYDEADFYFAIVHPPFHAIGRRCDMDLEETPEDFNGGQPMPCPTCRIAWLKSDECMAMIQSADLDQDILESLRTTLLDSYQKGREFHAAKLRLTDQDIVKSRAGKEGKGAYDDADLYYARTLHKKPEHVEQAEIQIRHAEAQGRAIGEAMKGSGGNDPTAGMTVEQKAAYWAEQAEFEKWKAEKAGDIPVPASIKIATSEDNAANGNTVEITSTLDDLSPLSAGTFITLLADGRKGEITMKPGGRYTVLFEDGSKGTFTRAEIAEFKEEVNG